jgi:hypothetical protein
MRFCAGVCMHGADFEAHRRARQAETPKPAERLGRQDYPDAGRAAGERGGMSQARNAVTGWLAACGSFPGFRAARGQPQPHFRR